jgi:hypothetical protein
VSVWSPKLGPVQKTALTGRKTLTVSLGDFVTPGFVTPAKDKAERFALEISFKGISLDLL